MTRCPWEMFFNVLNPDTNININPKVDNGGKTHETTTLSAIPHNHFDDPTLKAVSVAALHALSTRNAIEKEWVAAVGSNWVDMVGYFAVRLEKVARNVGEL